MQDSLGGNAKTLMLVVHASYRIVYIYTLYITACTSIIFYKHYVYYI